MREDTRTLVFAGAVCITCSLLLSGMAAGLKGFQKANEEFDVKRNIVKAFGVDIGGATAESVAEIFRKHIEERVVDAETGTVVAEMDPLRIPSDAADKKALLPLYAWMEDGKATKYAFPVSGKGLWGMIYGYLALDADLETIAGISFYKHAETPGLGAEIEKDWFQSQFSGKQLYNDDGEPTDFKVVKPGSARGDAVVDGISGATLTGKGVENLLRHDARLYADYFKKIEGN